jgi:SAM-dependent methyltransferase
MGEDLWRRLQGKLVLEAGCGAGRFTEVLLAQGARVVSVDLSDAVEANASLFPESTNHRIAQADLLHLPFSPAQFNVVFCLGVVQHTPDPEQTIARLYEHVRPGGWLVLDHYTYSLGWFLSLKPLWRQLLRRLPPDRGLEATERIVDRLLPLHRRASGVPRKVLNRFSPVITYYRMYPQLSDELQREWALLDTHDSQTDRYKRFRTCRGIRGTLERLGLEAIHCGPGSNGIDARGRRPRAR